MQRNTVRLSEQYQPTLHKNQLFKSIPQIPKCLIISWNRTEITATPVQRATTMLQYLYTTDPK